MTNKGLIWFFVVVLAALITVTAFPSLFMPLYPRTVGRTVAQLLLALFFAVMFTNAVVRKGWQARIAMLASATLIAFGVFTLRGDAFDIAYAGVLLLVLSGAAFLRKNHFRPEEAGRRDWILLTLTVAGGCWAVASAPTALINSVVTATILGRYRSLFEVGFGSEWDNHLAWLAIALSSGLLLVAWVRLGLKAFDYFASKRAITISILGRRLVSCWLVSLGLMFIGFVFVSLDDAFGVFTVHQDYLSSFGGFAGMGALLFLVIIPFLLGYRSASTGLKRKSMFAVATFVAVTIGSARYLGNTVFSADASVWYSLLTTLRGIYLPSEQRTIAIHFPGRTPSLHDVMRLLSLMDMSHPKAFVFVDPIRMEWNLPVGTFDSLLRSAVRHAEVVVAEEYTTNVPLDARATRDRLLITPLLNTNLHFGGGNRPYAFTPTYGDLLDVGAATAMRILARESGNQRSSLADVFPENDIRKPIAINRYVPFERSFGFIYPLEWMEAHSSTYSLSALSTSWLLDLDSMHVARGYEKADAERRDEISVIRDKVIVFSVQRGGEWWNTRPAVYADIIQNILDRDHIRLGGIGGTILLFVVFLTGLILFYLYMRPWKAFLLSVAAGVAVAALLAVLFAEGSLYLHPYPYLFAWAGSVLFLLPFSISSDRREILEERTRLTQELRSARDMQMGLMPKADPVIQGFEIAGICRPASEVGGDFYDYVWLDKKKSKLGIAIADVSGKAMKAAMTAIMTSGMMYSETQKSSSPREILRGINHPLYLRSDRRMFTALGFSVVDMRRKTLTFASAGQAPPIRIRNARADELLMKGNRLPLGVQDELSYAEATVALRKGDVLVFYTDGIVEAMNAEKEMYGFERLKKDLERWNDFPATSIRDRLMDEVGAFVGDAPQHDDMTVVVVRVK